MDAFSLNELSLPGFLEVSISVLAYSLVLVVSLPLIVLCLECLMALVPFKTGFQNHVAIDSPRTAVLIPAHNEAEGIGKTLAGVRSQLSEGDRLVVVADNCTDATAHVAQSYGAEVLERFNPEQRGKGYALDYGMAHLSAQPPDVVVMMDADCLIEEGALPEIAHHAHQSHRPVQAVYLMQQPESPSPKSAVSTLAFLVKNWVRPLGLHHIGMPCLLTGTGMAFPWDVIRHAPLASGNIVEDMQLGLDLAIAGHPPLLCPAAKVSSQLPQGDRASVTQRTRWEHGHLQTLLTQVPRLLKGAIAQGRIDLLALALDLSVPPLSLLVLLWIIVFLLAAVNTVINGIWMPLMILGIEGIMLMAVVLTAWGRFARDILPLNTLLLVPLYIASKVSLYFQFLARPEKEWVRTERDSTRTP